MAPRSIIGPFQGSIVSDVTGNGAGASYSFNALAYRKIDYCLETESTAFGGLSLTLTGMSANTYNETYSQWQFSTPNAAPGVNTYNGKPNLLWTVGDGGPFTLEGTLWLPSAPWRKRHRATLSSGVTTLASLIGACSDVTHDPTGIVFGWGGGNFNYRLIVSVTP